MGLKDIGKIEEYNRGHNTTVSTWEPPELDKSNYAAAIFVEFMKWFPRDADHRAIWLVLMLEHVIIAYKAFLNKTVPSDSTAVHTHELFIKKIIEKEKMK